jgi:cytidylate kinase
MERKLIITIDGPSGAGKSTLSRLLAEKLNYTYIDSGALYRAVALKVQQDGVDPDDDEALCRLCNSLAISFHQDRGRLTVMLNGADVTDAIRSPEISMLASRVSARKTVRAALLDLQRRLGDGGGIVVEGRDMGTVVFPGAEVKFFLDASLETRGTRRFRQYREQGKQYDIGTITRDIEKRDSDDSLRALSPLKPAPDAYVIDSTDMSIEEVVAEMLKTVARHLSPSSK